MSGECEHCGEHALDCDCDIEEKDAFEFLDMYGHLSLEEFQKKFQMCDYDIYVVWDIMQKYLPKWLSKTPLPLGLRCTNCHVFASECQCEFIHYNLMLSPREIMALGRKCVECPFEQYQLDFIYIPPKSRQE